MKLPDVILLNGAPSAGKTQLALALQAILPILRVDQIVRRNLSLFTVGRSKGTRTNPRAS